MFVCSAAWFRRKCVVLIFSTSWLNTCLWSIFPQQERRTVPHLAGEVFHNLVIHP